MKIVHLLKSAIIAVPVLCITACETVELPVPKHETGNIITATVDMHTDYSYQIFYDLETHAVISQNLKTDWDLGFETSPAGNRIILNAANAMFAMNTANPDFSSVTDTAGFAMAKVFDAPTGNMDSTAIGNWQEGNPVYIIDRGIDASGIHRGFRKIQILAVDSSEYTVKFAEMDGSGETTLQIVKDTLYNFTFLSFQTNNTILIEPPKTDWDLLFTQYLEALNPPYLVTGCILNRYNTAAKMDSTRSFEAIDLNFILSHTLSPHINSIGYTWKEYDFDAATYEVYPRMNYLIQDSDGFYYKLHFLDFYDQSGNKGNPTWEFQKL